MYIHLRCCSLLLWFQTQFWVWLHFRVAPVIYFTKYKPNNLEANVKKKKKNWRDDVWIYFLSFWDRDSKYIWLEQSPAVTCVLADFEHLQRNPAFSPLLDIHTLQFLSLGLRFHSQWCDVSDKLGLMPKHTHTHLTHRSHSFFSCVLAYRCFYITVVCLQEAKVLHSLCYASLRPRLDI